MWASDTDPADLLITPLLGSSGMNSLMRLVADANGVNRIFVGSTDLGGVGQTFTWTTKPLASVLSGQIFISDVGVGGSYWYSDGSKWRPVGGRVTIKNNIADITNNAAPKVVLDYATIPAGLWLDGDVIEFSYTKERTGGVADTDATDIMIGTVAATPGNSTGINTSGLAAANITLSSGGRLRKESATNVRPLAIAGTTGGMGASTAANTVVVMADMDANTTYLQITSDLTMAGGEVVHLRGFTVTLIAGT
jgi:hypothetical protein